jgi:predicted CoA-binding protein
MNGSGRECKWRSAPFLKQHTDWPAGTPACTLENLTDLDYGVHPSKKSLGQADGEEVPPRGRLIETPAEIDALLGESRRVAVLGIKTAETGQPAYYVPEYAQRAGFEIIPVPVYFPEVTEILGMPVYRRIADIPGPIDIVNVFRRSRDVPPHVDDILAKRPRAVWMQLGIRNDDAAERLTAAGIDVVQDRCLLVEIERAGPALASRRK